KIVYVNESDNYEPAKAVLAFKKLLDVDKVFCFVSGLGVAPTNAVVPEVQNRKVPYLMIGGNASKFFFPPKRYVFGVWATFEDYMRLLVDYVAIDLKMPNARVAHIFQDDETGRDSQKGFEEQVAKYPGMVIVATEGCHDRQGDREDRLETSRDDEFVQPGRKTHSTGRLCSRGGHSAELPAAPRRGPAGTQALQGHHKEILPGQ
ncbi:MAG: ABC transporter substrate-binding protein, partial [Thermodesulfobacteriota bacterium]